MRPGFVLFASMSFTATLLSDAEAAQTCGEGYHYYHGWVCTDAGAWEFGIVGFEQFNRYGQSLVLGGHRTNCVQSERAVGGGGEEDVDVDCIYSPFELAPVGSDCDLPQEKCEPAEVPPGEPDPEPTSPFAPWYEVPLDLIGPGVKIPTVDWASDLWLSTVSEQPTTSDKLGAGSGGCPSWGCTGNGPERTGLRW